MGLRVLPGGHTLLLVSPGMVAVVGTACALCRHFGSGAMSSSLQPLHS